MKKDNLKQFYKEFPSNPDARVKALKSILEKKEVLPLQTNEQSNEGITP